MKPNPHSQPRHAWLGGWALATACLLLGCSRSNDPAAAAGKTSATPQLAVARGKVDIEGGLLNLSMAREGTLVQLDAHEGDHVSKGQLLARLDTEPAQLAVEAAQAQLAQAEAQLNMLGIKQAAARQRAKRLAAAVAADAGDGQSADDAHEALAQIGAEQQSATAARAMARQKLDEARYELAQRSLLAPFDADVIRLWAQNGATVSTASGPLFTLLPRQPRIVRAELNESFVGTVQPGMSAEVIAGEQHYHAHVVRIGQVYGPATLENDPQVRANARTVECILAFDPPQDLRIGQRVTVRFGVVANQAK